jgi:hypothetical protein
MFDTLGGVDEIMRAAMVGDLTPQRCIKALSARKTSSPYLRNLVRRARDSGHQAMAARICRRVLAEGHDAFFVKQLQEMGEPLFNKPKKDAASA